MTSLRFEIDELAIAKQIAALSDNEQAEFITDILAVLGAHAYQEASDYLRDNPAETVRCPRCGDATFIGGSKGTTCHKCNNRWMP